jgi:GntR family transcriptional regulator, transcriptional repressor for pyruvate dehydrogenase complex
MFSNKKGRIVELSDRKTPSGNYSHLNQDKATPGSGKTDTYNLGLSVGANRSDKIINAVVEYISDMGLGPGQKLPTEGELCKIIGVGTRSIREALNCLKGIGIVKSQHGTGWYIEKFDPAGSLKFLSPLLKNFSGADLLQILQTRLTMEPMIAKLASANITPRGLERLDRILQQMLEIISDPADEMDRDQFRMKDRMFHDVLAQECGNNVLAMMGAMLTGLFYSADWKSQKYDMTFIVQQHQRILDAVKRGDGDMACKMTEEHLERAIETAKEMFNKTG